jgi:hypothetical protein
LWLADIGVYDGMEQNAKFQLLQSRCEAVMSQVEEAASRQIQSLMTVAVDAADKDKDKDTGKEKPKEGSPATPNKPCEEQG